MGDVMAVVDQKNWHGEERWRGHVLALGEVLRWAVYRSKNKLLELYLEPGDRLFLVTARGERLWLVAVYEGVAKKNGTWHAQQDNRTPIIDITSLRTKFRFHTGKGLTSIPGKLGNSLQAPRLLVDADIQLLEAALARKKITVAAAPRVAPDLEATEGEMQSREVAQYRRDPRLGKACLQRDDYTCRHCGFRVDTTRFPHLAARMSRVVHAHHVRPVSTGRRKAKASELVTLCPTCHAVAHALALSHRRIPVALALLAKYYRPFAP